MDTAPKKAGSYKASDITIRETFGDHLDPSDAATIGKIGFLLRIEGHQDVRCHYAPTHGIEGFGKKRRKVTYPAGKIVVELGDGRTADASGLSEALKIVVDRLNMAAEQAPEEPEAAPGMRR